MMENVKDIDYKVGFDPNEASPWRVMEAHVDLGADLLQAHHLREAEVHLLRVIEVRGEADWRPGNAMAQDHLAGLAYFNLGLVYTEMANLLTDTAAKKQAYERAIGQFLLAIMIGEQVPNLQAFNFDSHRWIATLRDDFVLIPETSSLGLDEPDRTFQDCLFEMIMADTQSRRWKQSNDPSCLENARNGFSRVVARMINLKEQGSQIHPHLDRLLEFGKAQLDQLDG